VDKVANGGSGVDSTLSVETFWALCELVWMISLKEVKVNVVCHGCNDSGVRQVQKGNCECSVI